MRILIFYQYFGTPAGSWSTRMYEMTRRWVKAGHSVTVVTSPYEKSDIKTSTFISRTEIEGIDLIVINSADSNRQSMIKRAMNALLFSFTSCRLALTEPCDIVLASSGPITVGLPALLAKWFRKKKMIFEIRDLWPQGAIELGKIKNRFVKSIAFGFEKMCYANSSLVVACSTGMAESVNMRFPKVKTLVIPNASDIKLFRGHTSHSFLLPEQFQNKKLVIYAGSLGLMDHGHLMIEAMRLVTNPEIILVVIGDGADREAMEDLTKKYNLNNVSFLGLIPKNEVAGWLSYADSSLILFKNYPVLQTSSPNKLFDAFAAGIPVIHNTTGWIKTVIDSEKCGISVGPNDAPALASAILKIAGDDNLRNEMASNSEHLADTTYNRDHVSEIYLQNIISLTE